MTKLKSFVQVFSFLSADRSSCVNLFAHTSRENEDVPPVRSHLEEELWVPLSRPGTLR